MAQWNGQFSDLTHDTKVRDLEDTMRKAVESLRAAADEERMKKSRALRKLANRLLAARLRCIRARIAAQDRPEDNSPCAEAIASLRQMETSYRSDGVDGVLREFGMDERISRALR